MKKEIGDYKKRLDDEMLKCMDGGITGQRMMTIKEINQCWMELDDRERRRHCRRCTADQGRGQRLDGPDEERRRHDRRTLDDGTNHPLHDGPDRDRAAGDVLVRDVHDVLGLL